MQKMIPQAIHSPAAKATAIAFYPPCTQLAETPSLALRVVSASIARRRLRNSTCMLRTLAWRAGLCGSGGNNRRPGVGVDDVISWGTSP
ncbi:uncharacterized protein SPSK_05743 [Sporothrix schenckii 1099-18]|uniref:Uncharacterized protein n=1 Tax=Sporothrix schenckii 1099-18 TaxID=1397361 RepID=A0A0F2LT97_SPOSC|nr:uncharacterized protein SPSK_05743 [Sporothrix schenckii 1099-18]KJR80707.1 hypothetical protein SPSK_05743 [Sporothrix schenckii 1099-18]